MRSIEKLHLMTAHAYIERDRPGIDGKRYMRLDEVVDVMTEVFKVISLDLGEELSETASCHFLFYDPHEIISGWANKIRKKIKEESHPENDTWKKQQLCRAKTVLSTLEWVLGKRTVIHLFYLNKYGKYAACYFNHDAVRIKKGQ